MRVYLAVLHQYKAVMSKNRVWIGSLQCKGAPASGNSEQVQQSEGEEAEATTVMGMVCPMMQWLDYLKSTQEAFQALLMPTASVPTPVTRPAFLQVARLAPKTPSVYMTRPDEPDIQVMEVHLKTVHQRVVSTLGGFLKLLPIKEVDGQKQVKEQLAAPLLDGVKISPTSVQSSKQPSIAPGSSKVKGFGSLAL